MQYCIYVADDFNDILIVTKKKNGKYSAEEFRDDVVIPILNKYEYVTIDFSDVKRVTKQFIHEVFYNISDKITRDQEELQTNLTISGLDSNLESVVWNCITD